jgi:hypothetical protein
VFVWENIWAAIAASLGMRPGGHVPLSLDLDIRPREEEWETICAQHWLRSGNLRDFAGLSFRRPTALRANSGRPGRQRRGSTSPSPQVTIASAVTPT